jgi:hypothetical protein
MDFLSEQRLMYSSKKNEEIYKFFNANHNIEIHEFFLFCVSIGFRMKKRVKFNEKGREFRSNYLKPSGRASMYSILLSVEVGYTINDFQDKDNHKIFADILEEYAEGGLAVLITEVFRSKYIDGHLDSNYRFYISDITNFVLSNCDVHSTL